MKRRRTTNSWNKLTDVELVVLLHQNDTEAFSEIYQRYWKKMLLVAWNHCKDKTHAEDIVHEVFISLWSRRSETLIENIAGFLTTAVKLSVFKYYQKERHRILLAQQNYDFNELVYDEAKIDALFLKAYINDLVEELPEKCRLTFRLSREDGLKNGEIAKRMNISEKGVEANLTRALRIIKGNLKDNGLFILLAPDLWENFF